MMEKVEHKPDDPEGITSAELAHQLYGYELGVKNTTDSVFKVINNAIKVCNERLQATKYLTDSVKYAAQIIALDALKKDMCNQFNYVEQVTYDTK